eukprot:15452917-Alexandrium_andersonii.AAC.1
MFMGCPANAVVATRPRICNPLLLDGARVLLWRVQALRPLHRKGCVKRPFTPPSVGCESQLAAQGCLLSPNIPEASRALGLRHRLASGRRICRLFPFGHRHGAIACPVRLWQIFPAPPH